MIPVNGGPFRLLCVIIWVTLHHSVYSVPAIADFNHNTNQVKARRSEYFTVHQETGIVRRRRDSVDHVGFPPVMDFSLNFKSGPIKLRLKRNEYMTPNVRLSDGHGPIEHDLGRKTGIYSDLEKRASFVVHCEDDMDHCTLTGSLEKDGEQWEITPEVETPQLHKAIESQSDGTINFGNYSITAPDPGIIRGHTTEAAMARRKKRAIPDCDIVECLAIVDETVWSFSLTNAGNNVTKAEEDITRYFLALYAQADLHYDFASARVNDSRCIRLFLGEIVIQKTTADSWSFPNQIAIQGLTGVFVNAVPGIITCGAQGNARRTETNTIDLTQCFTRKDIAWNEDSGTVYYPSYRGLGFKDVACNVSWSPYTAAIMEAYGDKVELLLAHEIVHGLGTDHDSEEGCVDTDRYIMTKQGFIPVDDFKLKNIWYFSTCTMRSVNTHLDKQPRCLRDNSFSEADYDAFKDVPLAGRIYNWDDQCLFRFGAASQRCDPTGQNRTYFSDMCGRGIYCTRNGVCDGVNRPYEGTSCGDQNAYCLKSECYIPSRELGGICECHNDCNGSNTMCSVTSKTCVCQDGYYNNGTTTAGSCLPKVDVGTACSSNISCLDTNAYCGGGGLCVCQEGFYTDSGACFVLKCVGEVCSSSEQCRGANSECSGSTSTCRCPADRYLDVTTGNCVTNKVLGESCEAGQCGTNNSVCDSTTNQCRCQEGFFDDNGSTAGGDCLPKVAIGTSCTQPDACADSNAECSSGTCSCKSDYVDISGTCERLRCAGEGCSTTNQCRGTNVECLGLPKTCRCPSDRYLDVTSGNCLSNKVLGESCETGQCGTNNSVCDSTTNQCRCQEGFFDDNGSTAGGDCLPKVALGTSCTQPDACADFNAECSSGTCSCKSDYVDISGTCERLRCAGESCSTTNQCRGANVECLGSPKTCRCPSDRYLDVTSGNCLSNKVLGESCEAGQCGTNNSVCDSTTNQCRCQEGFFDDNGSTAGGDCLPKVALGISCTEPDACADSNAECSSGTCSCKSDYVDISGTCERLKCFGESCEPSDQCKGNFVSCLGVPTTCRCPSGRYIDEITGNCEITPTTMAPPSTTTAPPPPPTTTAPPPPSTTAPPTTTAPPPPTTTTAPPPTTTASGRCRPAPAYENVAGMQEWCDQNCPGPTCLPSHCICP